MYKSKIHPVDIPSIINETHSHETFSCFRYRKNNLYLEPDTNRPDVPELVAFETDFGQKFGIFTCFDIIFEAPAIQLVRRGVDNFIFPTLWIPELPFLTSEFYYIFYYIYIYIFYYIILYYSNYWSLVKRILFFNTANQVQQMWAQGNDVTLLASGASFPRYGSGGVGIYLGKKLTNIIIHFPNSMQLFFTNI